jgi:hypothetical protein
MLSVDAIQDYFNSAKGLLLSLGVKKIVSVILFIVLICTSGIFYRHQRFLKDKAAFEDLCEVLDRYEGLLKFGNREPLIEFAEDCNKFSVKHYSSSLYYKFKMCESAAYSFAGMNDECFKIYELLGSKFTDSSRIGVLYKIGIAFSFLNSDKDSDKLFGEKLINECMSDTDNVLHETAIFYYGLYKLRTDSLISADNIWSPFFNNPNYKESVYCEIIKLARNCDF